MSSWSWLITGASSGLGTAIALAALEAGHAVVATARNVPKARQDYPEVERKGGVWLALDVTQPDTQDVVERAVKDHKVNVIVNNAGFALRNALEDLTLDQVRTVMETNFFGAVAVTKGALPTFRMQRNSVIVNISSTSGIHSSPGYSMYGASKHAMEGMSEALSAELRPFNIRVLIVEPGAFRTNFQAVVKGVGFNEGTSSAYQGTPADNAMRKISSDHGKQPGDPAKAGRAIVDAVAGTGDGASIKENLRLPLGKDAVQRASTKLKSFSDDVERARKISESAVFDDKE